VRFRLLICATLGGCLYVSHCQAGKIIVVEPLTPTESYTKTAAESAGEKARQYIEEKALEDTLIIKNGPVESPTTEQAKELRQGAREYLSSPSSENSAKENVLILYAAPPTDVEKTRIKARSYIDTKSRSKDCEVNTGNQVGMIGDVAMDSNNKGSVVVTHCR
jgi:hypothetical protein